MWGWKWFTVIFEMTYVADCVVSIIYWSVIYFAKDIQNEYSPGFQVVSGYIHATPLISMIVDYMFHTLPLVKRHGFLMPMTGFLYCLVNFTHAKISGEPVYDPVLMWNAPIDYIFGFGVILMSCVLFSILYLLNQKKLRSLSKYDAKHGVMADICECNMDKI